MTKLKAWVQAARLRTLPLSLAGIIGGTALANEKGHADTLIFILALLTTVAFQVTSNFANDYGDGVKGTDGENRVGPKRAIQSGSLKPSEIKKGIWISAGISLVLAVTLIIGSLGVERFLYVFLFFLLALLSIWASITYTVGKSPYGYRGLGDVFVFVFFGLVAVLGSEFLYAKTFDPTSIFVAIAIGLLSVAVLNLNNLRDHDSDKLSGKNTIVVKMGFEKGKRYHYALLVGSLLSLLGYTIITQKKGLEIIYLLAYVPIVMNLVKVNRTKIPRNLDPELKRVALSIFLLSILLYLSINYFF